MLNTAAYNYDGRYLGYAAHTIGHRDIVIGNKQEKGEDNNDSSINLTNVHSTSGMVDANISGAQTDSGKFLRNAIQSGEIVSEIDESASRTSDNGRTLIVVSIRVLLHRWIGQWIWLVNLTEKFSILNGRGKPLPFLPSYRFYSGRIKSLPYTRWIH